MGSRGMMKWSRYHIVGPGLFSLLALILFQEIGCTPCAHDMVSLYLQGRLLDTEALEGATDAAVGGRTFTDGEQTDFRSPLIYDGSSRFPSPSADGTFQVVFTIRSLSCEDRVEEFPPPDQIQVIVVRGGCEQTFLIDINEDTVVDLDFPDNIIELKDPILVEPCAD